MANSDDGEFHLPADEAFKQQDGTNRELMNEVRNNKKVKLLQPTNQNTPGKKSKPGHLLKLPEDGTGLKLVNDESLEILKGDDPKKAKDASSSNIVPLVLEKAKILRLSQSPSQNKEIKILAKAFGDDMILNKRKGTNHQNDGTPRNSISRTSDRIEDAQNMAIIEALTIPDIQAYINNDVTIDLLEYKNIQKAFGSTKLPNLKTPIPKVFLTPQMPNTAAMRKRASVGNPEMLNRQLNPIFKDNKSEKQARYKDVSDRKTLFNAISFKLKPAEIRERLNRYVPIAIMLTYMLNHEIMAKKLFYYDKAIQDDTGLKDVAKMLENEMFVVKLIDAIVLYDENKAFDLLMAKFNNWDIWFRDSILDALLSQSKIGYLTQLLTTFSKQLKDAKTVKQRGSVALMMNPSLHQTISKSSEISQSSSPKKEFAKEQNTGTAYVREKMLLVIKKYFNYFQSNTLLLDILNNIDLKPKEIAEMLIMTQDEDRVVELLLANKELTKHLDPVKIISFKQYKLLVVFGSVALVNIFNMSVSGGTSRSKKSHRTVFQELCHNIKGGFKIQSLCFMIMNVDVVFWDFDRCWRFYQAINAMVRQESRVNWLAYVDNPLLFFIKVSYFFKMILMELGVESKEIEDLRDDLCKFCIKYMHASNDETLIINFFDKDNKGLTFIDYSFMNRKSEILEVDFVARIIMRMWDLGRDSKQSLREFFRLTAFYRQNRKFTFESMKKYYKVPIENDDAFHLDYLLTSHSVYLSVLSDVLWLIVLILAEFIMSMRIIHLHRTHGLVQEFHWILKLYSHHLNLTIVFLYLRCSFVMTCLARLLAMNWERNSFLELKDFYYTYLILSLIQMIIYPLYYHGTFWPLNILQMLITITLIIYGYYLSLALQPAGIVLRIFARMFGIVIVFGMASMVIICAIAYPIHVIFADFDMIDDSGAQLNLFYDLYTGVLTMFEFVFGAVIFIRNYTEQNLYTYSMTFVMVLFSFFGNIMLANLLVAFLANQFTEITKRARYYTLKMQYQLTTVLRPKDLDTIYSTPFWLTPVVWPLYILMAIRGTIRKNVNSYLRKAIHVINTAIPWLIFYTGYLIVLFFSRYIGTAAKIVLQLLSPKLTNVPLFFVWVAIGPFYLLYLFLCDIGLVAVRLFDLRQKAEVEMHMITFDEDERKDLCKLFTSIFDTSQYLMRHKQIKRIAVKQFVYELGRQGSVDAHDNLSIQSDSDSDDSGLIKVNANKFMVSKKYRVRGMQLVTSLVEKFVNKDDKIGTDGITYEEIDLQFVVDKLRNNLVPEKVHLLIAFNKEHLEAAREEMIADEDKDSKNDIMAIRSRLDDLTKDVSGLVKSIQRIEARMNRPDNKK